MKKNLCVTMVIFMMFILIGCQNNKANSNTETTHKNKESASDKITDNEPASIGNASTYSSKTYNNDSLSKTDKRYCEVDDCYKEGIKEITGLSGKVEYYCYDHYQEMQDIISMMEEDVGSGTESKHQCEECSKEGTREIIGLSGTTEYYCTEHYNEMIEILDMLYGE